MYTKNQISYTSTTASARRVAAPAKVAARIVGALEGEILEGRLSPGMRLDEQELAKRFQVSRTPVREALLELTSQGLVMQVAHRGTFVADLSLEDVLGTYEVLAKLEGLCAKLATRRMSATQKQELKQLHDRMANSLDSAHRSQYIALDAAFHDTLVAGAHNSALAEHIRLCHKKITPVRMSSMHSVADMAVAHTEHEALLQAMLAGEDDLAERLMTVHVAMRAEQVRDLAAVWSTRRAAIAPLTATAPAPQQGAKPQGPGQTTAKSKAPSRPRMSKKR